MMSRSLFLAALTLSGCTVAIGAPDPVLVQQKRQQIQELQQKLDALQKAEKNAEQLGQLKTEQSRLQPIVSMATRNDGRIDALRQKVAGADAALAQAQKEWDEFRGNDALSLTPIGTARDMLRVLSMLRTSNRDRYRALASALEEARRARRQVEPDVAELQKLLREQKELRECPDPDFPGQDLQACQARLAELDKTLPTLSQETVTARGDRVDEINRVKEEISKLNRELADMTRTPAATRPASQPAPSLELKWPDKDRIAKGVGAAEPEAGTARLEPCAVSLQVWLNGINATVVPRLRIDVEGFGTFWAFPIGQPAEYFAIFELYVPVPEGPFTMTLSAPGVPDCQPVTIRSVRLRPDRAPTVQRVQERLSRLAEFKRALDAARTEQEARGKHYQLGSELALVSSDLTELSRFPEALQYALAAAQHLQAAGNIGDGWARQSLQMLIATAAFVGGNIPILEEGLSASAEFYRQMAEREQDRSKADSFFSIAGHYHKLAGNCIATIGGESELPRARAAWRRAMELEARTSRPDTRCPAWAKE